MSVIVHDNVHGKVRDNVRSNALGNARAYAPGNVRGNARADPRQRPNRPYFRANTNTALHVRDDAHTLTLHHTCETKTKAPQSGAVTRAV